MKLSTANKKKLIEEIEFALNSMKVAEDPETKLYYFSAVYGVMPRIFNIEYDPNLVFIHFVVNATYNNINSRLKNPEKVVKIPDDLFEKLENTTNELLNTLKQNKNLYEVLKKFILLAYVTSGNGYYLYQRGLLKI